MSDVDGNSIVSFVALRLLVNGFKSVSPASPAPQIVYLIKFESINGVCECAFTVTSLYINTILYTANRKKKNALARIKCIFFVVAQAHTE